MPGQRHSTAVILQKLRQAEEMRAKGATTRDICRAIEVAENTYQRWKHQYGGLSCPDKRRLTQLEEENRRLREVVTTMALDLQAAREHVRALEIEPHRPQFEPGTRNGSLML